MTLVTTTSNHHEGSIYEEDPKSASMFSEPENKDETTVHEEHALAERETQAVRCSRLVVVFVLSCATALVSGLVYTYVHRTETSEFESTFSDYAEQITNAVHRTAQNKLEAIGAIALIVQGHAINSGSTWPNVTTPFFEEYIMSTQSLTDAYGVQLFPIVTKDQREGWEAYSVEHREWLNESYAAQRRVYGVDESRLEPGETAEPDFDWFTHLFGDEYYNESNPDFSSGIANRIFGTTFHQDRHPIIDQGDGPYFPQWQTAPASAYYQSTVNSNYGNFEDFFNQTQIITETSAAAYGMAWTDPKVPGYISTLLYPIFEEFYGNGSSNVVAFASIDLLWQAFIERILPPSAEGIYVVIENGAPCNQRFTFEIFGNEAIFLGEGDSHETDFDHMEEAFLFGSKLMEPISSLTYTGRPLYDDFCPYTFRLYPSHTLRSQYVTNKPVFYTLIVCVIFGFTSLVFLIYDWIVEARQRLVLSSANQADAVVSSLFPRGVKEQLYAERKQKQANEEDVEAGAAKQKDFTADHIHPSMSNEASVSPLAQLYPATTILFADLVGFTSWSSTRQPSEVFQLLETLYGSFDASARRRRVFKVETIGDCYVAVAGLPRPQPQHALIMTRFADDCRLSMRQDLHKLAESLGPSTLDLALRIGLHSGSVTAGVLRGDKQRFQLFGSSMNQAARMEQNSAPNRIHVSDATAKLLRKAGKAHWISEREEKISPKGLGKIQTYWVDLHRDGRSSLASSEGSPTDIEAGKQDAAVEHARGKCNRDFRHYLMPSTSVGKGIEEFEAYASA